MCNTTSRQWLAVGTGSDVQSLGAVQQVVDLLPHSYTFPATPRDINSVLQLWAIMVEAAGLIVTPTGLVSRLTTQRT